MKLVKKRNYNNKNKQKMTNKKTSKKKVVKKKELSSLEKLMLGKTIKSIEGLEEDSEKVIFTLESGEQFKMHHLQDCCEYVDIEDIEGDIEDLIGSPLTMAEESSNSDDPAPEDKGDDSHTWTYYRFATVKGYVTIRWFGSSNGYYSEAVEFIQIAAGGNEVKEERKQLKPVEDPNIIKPVIMTPYRIGFHVGPEMDKKESIHFIENSTSEEVLQSMVRFFNLLHSAELEIDVLTKAGQENADFIRAAGLEMMMHPFLPDYLGFEQTAHEGNILYTKDNFVITQKEDKWVIIKGDEVAHYTFADMFDAFVTLRSKGCNVTIEEWQKSGGGEILNENKIREEAKGIDEVNKELKI